MPKDTTENSELPLPPTTVNLPPETSRPPTTTAAQDLTLAGQRRINLVWEGTQAAIAVVVTAAIVYTAVQGISSPELTNAFFLIIGFYFSRVNHQAIGGTGQKATDDDVYQGR